ncbi:divergent polysaccharide deacetylase family protein [Rhodobacteraceae bacterium NNCM2]|nr:divergent polysaccharide deacetylase family protein [Coraliihabitans acroporae]
MKNRDILRDVNDFEQPRRWSFGRFTLGVIVGLLICAVGIGWVSKDFAPPAGDPVLSDAPAEAPEPIEDPVVAEEADAPEPEVVEITEAEVQPEGAGGPLATLPQEPAAETEPAVAETAPEPVIETTDETAAVSTAPESTPAVSADSPAWERNAVEFSVANGTPLVAIVLESPDTSDVPFDVIAALGLPLTMGIEPVTETAIAYGSAARAAGFELVARIPMLDRREPGASADLIHPAMSADEIGQTVNRLVGHMPEAVAVSGAGGRLSASNAGMVEAVITAIHPDGYAYLDDSGQANSAAPEIAERLGADIAGDVRVVTPDMTDEQIYRLFEVAAQSASATGTAVVTAPANVEVLISLQRWALERNGRDARLAPLSAVIGKK